MSMTPWVKEYTNQPVGQMEEYDIRDCETYVKVTSLEEGGSQSEPK